MKRSEALSELARAGDLPPPGEDHYDKSGQNVQNKGKGKVRESSSGSEASDTLRDSQSPLSASTPPVVSPSSGPVYHAQGENYQYLPVRSEDLGRQPYPYDYSPGVPEYQAAGYSQYQGAPAWNFNPANAAPQGMAQQFNGEPAASDGLLRTLAAMAGNQAGGFMQAAQNAPAPADFASGENVLGMWSNLSGNMQ